MKRFLVFMVVLIVTVSLGFTTYAFLKNNEQITLLQANFYVNKGDEIEINFDVVNKKKQTKYNYVLGGVSGLASTESANVFRAVNGGEYTFDIETTNKNYPVFSVSVVIGDGSENYPFFIKNKQQFLNIGNGDFTLASHYKLTADIDLNGETFAGFGDFSGTFNGNNCSVFNATYNGTDKTNMGMFASISQNAIVKNVNLVNFSYEGSFANAAIVSAYNYGTIKNVNIVNSSITNNASNGKTAGVACVNETKGTTAARIDRCASDVTIRAKNSVGGVCVNNKGAIVINSYSKGDLVAQSATTNIAGIVTYNEATNDNVSYVKNCYSISRMSTIATGRASIIYKNTNAYSNNNVIMGCYFSEEKTLCDLGVVGVESNNYNYLKITTEQLKDISYLISYISLNSTPVTWDSSLWLFGGENEGFPHLDFLSADVADKFNSSQSGSEINTAEELIAVFNQPTTAKNHYVISSDIDLAGYADFAPLGVDYATINEFNGTLEAGFNTAENRYYEIKNLTITSNNANSALIAQTGKTAQIINIVLNNVKISAGTNIGALVGINNGLITNCTVNSAENALGGAETVVENLGGLCGVNNGTISNCVVNAPINAKTYSTQVNAGGVVGLNNNIIYNTACNSAISVTGSDDIYVGGIAGNSKLSVLSSIFSGSIVADMNAVNHAGGIVGYASNSAIVSKSRFNGTIEAYNVGGLIAFSQKSYVYECTVEGSLKGFNIGGVAFTAPEIVIDNLSVVCTMEGRDDSAMKAGIAVELHKNDNSYCGPIFLAVTFIGDNNNYVTSYYVTNTAWPWEWNPTSIPVAYCVFDIDTMANAKRWILFDTDEWIIPSIPNAPINKDGATPFEKCIGYETGTTFTDRGFKTDIWEFVVDEYPMLKNCKK